MTSEDGKVLAAQNAATMCDAVIVGAGFGGMYAIIKLREIGLSVQAFEAGDDVGGTWYWNTYPGARCDLDSLNYSYGFSDELQQHWNWPEDYSRQPDILKYCQHVAD
jgi:cyclohexanone monooxygenase